jgi:hypothetical protein
MFFIGEICHILHTVQKLVEVKERALYMFNMMIVMCKINVKR